MFSRQSRIWSFHVFFFSFLQRTVKKCTKNYNTRAQLLSCRLNRLFSDVPVSVVVFFSFMLDHLFSSVLVTVAVGVLLKVPHDYVCNGMEVFLSAQVRRLFMPMRTKTKNKYINTEIFIKLRRFDS